jgi:hypothetical protein
MSSAPHAIIHSNAAFAKLTGLDTTSLLAEPFSSIMYRDTNAAAASDEAAVDSSTKSIIPSVSLVDCVVSSSHGEHRILQIRCLESGTNKVLERNVRVSPIVERKSTESEVTDVSHFAIEILEEQEDASSSAGGSEDGSLTDDNDNGFAIGVMG